MCPQGCFRPISHGGWLLSRTPTRQGGSGTSGGGPTFDIGGERHAAGRNTPMMGVPGHSEWTRVDEVKVSAPVVEWPEPHDRMNHFPRSTSSSCRRHLSGIGQDENAQGVVRGDRPRRAPLSKHRRSEPRGPRRHRSLTVAVWSRWHARSHLSGLLEHAGRGWSV
jgi:hypothetical protein